MAARLADRVVAVAGHVHLDLHRTLHPGDLEDRAGLDLEHVVGLALAQHLLEGGGVGRGVGGVVWGEAVGHHPGLRFLASLVDDGAHYVGPHQPAEAEEDGESHPQRDEPLAEALQEGGPSRNRGSGAGGGSGCRRRASGGRGGRCAADEEPGEDPQSQRRPDLPVPRPAEQVVREDEPHEQEGEGQEQGQRSIHG